MKKFGQVISYDESRHEAQIRYVRPDACAKCGACGSLNKTGSITLPCEQVQVGNWVRISFPDRHFVSSAFIAYTVPFLTFLAGVLAGYFLSGGNELWGLAGGMIGIGISLLILKLTQKKLAHRADWVPQIDRIYEQLPGDISEIGCGAE